MIGLFGRQACRWHTVGNLLAAREVAVSQLLSHTDPLLEFTTELGESPSALPEPKEVAETPEVTAARDAVTAAPDDGVALRGRVDQLE